MSAGSFKTLEVSEEGGLGLTVQFWDSEPSGLGSVGLLRGCSCVWDFPEL